MDNSIGSDNTIQPGDDTSQKQTLSPGATLGQYKVIRLLGRGGMGEVYEVEHITLDRQFALKILPEAFASRTDALERFRREARVMANLEHPNIIRVDEFGETDGRYWLRMELAEGTSASEVGDPAAGGTNQKSGVKQLLSLEEYAKTKGGRLNPDEAQIIFTQILQGLAYAHSRGVVHRDLKPSNILICPDADSNATFKIADFGLVRMVGEEWVRSQADQSIRLSMSMGNMATEAPESAGTSTRSMIGTYEYMSPEQKRGEEATAASDVYALGLMMFRLLTGRQLGMKRPSELVDSLDPAWDEVISNALDEDPADRFAAAGAMLAEIGKLASPGQPGQREPALSTEPVAKKSSRQAAIEPLNTRNTRKKGGGFFKVAAALLVLGALAAGGWWFMNRKASESPAPTSEPPSTSSTGSTFSSPKKDLGTRRVTLEEQPLPNDLVAVVDADHAPLSRLAPGSREAQASQMALVQKLGLPLEVKSKKTGIAFRLVPPGSFTMGSPTGESGRDDDEKQHRVTLTEPFYCGKFEVTQRQWKQVMGDNPSSFDEAGLDAPVERVSWDDCQKFLDKLCALEGVPRGTYRLLTEAQWEYACRAGTETRFCFGDSDGNLKDYGNYEDTPRYGDKTTAPVGSFKPNAWGLYDMHGNVYEWCQDWFGNYPMGSVTDPKGPRSGSYRVARGGGWFIIARSCRSANRYGYTPGYRDDYLGFRLMRAVP